jgi:hypothetical protein
MLKYIWIRLVTRFSHRPRLRPQGPCSAAARMARVREHEYRRKQIEAQP